jgi:molybdopterin converting factor small subunit
MIALRILCFAHARDTLGFADKIIECDPAATPREILRSHAGGTSLPHPDIWRVALDHEYADWDAPIGNAAEMAVLPPVSGG